MQLQFRTGLMVFLFLGLFSPEVMAQETDTFKKYQDTVMASPTRAPFYKSKIFKASVVPALFIGYGLTTIKDNGLYSSYNAQRDILRNFPNFHTKIDDALVFAPFAELALVNLLNIRSNNDFLNTSILIMKAEAINAVFVLGLKNITNQERPNGENRYSLPSGHTAHAFLAASILHSELRHKSQWYGIGAYTIATSVGVLRMLNNEHWQSDVLVGAGIGIMSSHAAYLSHRNRWGRKPAIVFMPTYIYGVPGIALSLNLNQVKSDNIPAPFLSESK
jgi:membrane-associated phospholipid phosphatase